MGSKPAGVILCMPRLPAARCAAHLWPCRVRSCRALYVRVQSTPDPAASYLYPPPLLPRLCRRNCAAQTNTQLRRRRLPKLWNSLKHIKKNLALPQIPPDLPLTPASFPLPSKPSPVCFTRPAHHCNSRVPRAACAHGTSSPVREPCRQFTRHAGFLCQGVNIQKQLGLRGIGLQTQRSSFRS